MEIYNFIAGLLNSISKTLQVIAEQRLKGEKDKTKRLEMIVNLAPNFRSNQTVQQTGIFTLFIEYFDTKSNFLERQKKPCATAFSNRSISIVVDNFSHFILSDSVFEFNFRRKFFRDWIKLQLKHTDLLICIKTFINEMFFIFAIAVRIAQETNVRLEINKM